MYSFIMFDIHYYMLSKVLLSIQSLKHSLKFIHENAITKSKLSHFSKFLKSWYPHQC